MHAHGNIWHSKDLKAGVVPTCGNIDIDARWGKSTCKGWVFGYKLHTTVMAASPAGIRLPLDVAVTPADAKDYDVFKQRLISGLPNQTQIALGDGGYAEDGCFTACDTREVSLLAPIKVLPNTTDDRRARAEFLRDPEVKKVYALRRTTVEPYQGQLKSLFDLEYLPIKGFRNVRTLCILATLAYCLLVSLNLIFDRPALQLKATLLALR
jgi:hypothetical protein